MKLEIITTDLTKHSLIYGPVTVDAVGALISLEFFASEKYLVFSISDEGKFYESSETKIALESGQEIEALFPSAQTDFVKIMEDIPLEHRFINTETKTLYLLFPLTR